MTAPTPVASEATKCAAEEGYHEGGWIPTDKTARIGALMDAEALAGPTEGH